MSTVKPSPVARANSVSKSFIILRSLDIAAHFASALGASLPFYHNGQAERLDQGANNINYQSLQGQEIGQRNA